MSIDVGHRNIHRINVRGGQARESDPPLCVTCRSGTVMVERGVEKTLCHALAETAMRVDHVSQCSRYDDRRIPARWDMEQIAWILSTSPGRKMGFLSPAEIAKRDDK